MELDLGSNKFGSKYFFITTAASQVPNWLQENSQEYEQIQRYIQELQKIMNRKRGIIILPIILLYKHRYHYENN